MSEKRRRRTLSAAESEVGSLSPPSNVESTQNNNRVRRKSSARQARLLTFPVPTNTPLKQSSVLNISQPLFSHMMYNPNSFIPPPRVTPNSITFTIYPQNCEASFSFMLSMSEKQNVTLYGPSSVPYLTFSLNKFLYNNVALPIDVSASVVQGNNYIVFPAYLLSNSICVELRTIDLQNPDVLMKQVIEQFPIAHHVNFSGSITKKCPISKKLIDNPARGDNCQHLQCFDLKSFLERAIQTQNWACPVCGMQIPFNDLRYDPSYLKTPEVLKIEEIHDDTVTQIFDSFGESAFEPLNGMFYDRDF